MALAFVMTIRMKFIIIRHYLAHDAALKEPTGIETKVQRNLTGSPTTHSFAVTKCLMCEFRLTQEVLVILV